VKPRPRAKPPAPPSHFWRGVRIFFLLFILAIAAWSNWIDRLTTTDWDEPLRIGVFPINAGGDDATAGYLEHLSPDRLADVESFINREAHRHGVAIDRPVEVTLFDELIEKPPARTSDGVFANVAWSLKMRLYARRNSRPPGKVPPQIRIFVMYHDPSFAQSVPHSVGMQKGLVGVVHAFAHASATDTNNVVIAHEILHTLGASDKYDPNTLAPLFPLGYADPDRDPRHPQQLAEVMAGRTPIDANRAVMPDSLDDVVVGNATALEIRWIRSP
jgi:hypothetical protein